MTEKVAPATSFKTWKEQNKVWDHNPLPKMTDLVVPTKTVKYGQPAITDIHRSELTGEQVAVHEFTKVKTVDEQQFVKIFKECLAAYHGLSKAAAQVFALMLEEYEKMPMHNGYADTVILENKGNTLNSRTMSISYNTWLRGIRELIEKRFLWPRTDNIYWINPQMFIKGNRISCLTEYNLLEKPSNRKINATVIDISDDEQHRAELEKRGQLRVFKDQQ